MTGRAERSSAAPVYDAFQAAVATPGLIWLIATSTLAGVVYGFAGFGAALVFMPLATVFVPPVTAVAAMSVGAISSFATVLRGAWAAADRRAALTMLVASIIATPFGILVLRLVDPVTLGWAVSGIVALTLIALMTGWRYQSVPGPRAWWSVGGIVGLMGGSTGLNGPALVLFQLGGRDQVARTRGNAMVVLTLNGIAMLPQMALQGVLPLSTFALGMILMVPYAVGTTLGRVLFRPSFETLYRNAAYGIIAAAVVLGLPLWS